MTVRTAARHAVSPPRSREREYPDPYAWPCPASPPEEPGSALDYAAAYPRRYAWLIIGFVVLVLILACTS